MAADLASEIVKLTVGLSPMLHIYRITFDQDGVPFSDRDRYFDEIVVHGNLVTHKFVDKHQIGRGYIPDLSRYTDESSHRVDLICNDPIPAMRIAFQADSNAKWAMDVNNIRVYEFIINSTKHYPLDKQEEFAIACSMVLSYR
jgi:hypothetical protein